MDKDTIFMGCGAMLSCMAWGGPAAAASGLLMYGGVAVIAHGLDSSSTMHKILLVAGGILAIGTSFPIVFHAAPLMFGTAVALESAANGYMLVNGICWMFGCVVGLVASFAIDVFQELRSDTPLKG